jgi:predicted phage terminase large subunit-like protein
MYPALATHDEYLDRRSGRIVRDTGELTTKHGLQLLRKAGEALHPERFPRSLLLKYKRTLQPRHWSALYQQQPAPDEGLFFTADMFRFRPHLPMISDLYTFAAWDLAIGVKNSNDWTVGIVGGLDWDDNLWILDMIRGRWNDTHQIATTILDASIRYDCIMTGIEKGQLELALKPHLDRVMKKRSTYIVLAEGDNALRPITDKMVRARPLQGRMQQGKVLFPADQPWVETAKNELLRFPTGTHDDIVDAMAWLARLVGGQAPPMKPSSHATGLPKGEKSWRERLASAIRSGEGKTFMAR